MTCLDPNILALFSEGRLFGAPRDAVIAHIADCPDCLDCVITAEDIHREDMSEGRGPDIVRKCTPEAVAHRHPLWRRFWRVIQSLRANNSEARKAPHLRAVDGGKSRVRRAYEKYRSNGSMTDASVITVSSANDAAYASKIAERRKNVLHSMLHKDVGKP